MIPESKLVVLLDGSDGVGTKRFIPLRKSVVKVATKVFDLSEVINVGVILLGGLLFHLLA